MITHSIKSNLSSPCKSRCPISIIFGYWILNRSNQLFQCPCLNEFANSFGSQNIFKMEKGPMNIRHNGHLKLHENRKLVFKNMKNLIFKQFNKTFFTIKNTHTMVLQRVYNGFNNINNRKSPKLFMKTKAFVISWLLQTHKIQ